MSCSTCFEVIVHKCLENLAIALGLTANTDYTVKFIDQFGNVYSEIIESDGSGHITVNGIDEIFPDGFFIKGRQFTIKIYDSSGQLVSFTIDSTDYSCISATVDGETNENSLIPSPGTLPTIEVGGVTYKQLPSPVGAIDDLNTIFTFVMKPEQVYWQGQKLVLGAATNGYTLSGAGNNIVTLTEAPATGDSVEGYATF